MKETGRMFWSLVMAWFLMMGFSNAPLLAKGEGNGQAKQQKGEKKAKKEKQQKAPKTQIVVPQRRVRIYSPRLCNILSVHSLFGSGWGRRNGSRKGDPV